MKANKALKRLSKINGLMSDVTERFAAKNPHIREVFEDLKAAFKRAKQAVTAQSSSVSKKKEAGVDKAARASKPITHAHNKNAVERSARKTSTAQSAQKHTPVKTTVKRKTPNRKPPATERAARESIHATS